MPLTDKPICIEGYKTQFGVKLGQSVTMSSYFLSNPALAYVTAYHNGVNYTLSTYPIEQGNMTYMANMSYTPRVQSDYGVFEFVGVNSFGIQDGNCSVWLLPSRAPDKPINCTPVVRSSASVIVECEEGFDGGSAVSYAIEVMGDEGWAVYRNTTTPRLDVLYLQPLSSYTVRVCSANAEFWQTRNCTAEFSITTERDNDRLVWPTSKVRDDNDDLPKLEENAGAHISTFVAIGLGSLAAVLLMCAFILLARNCACPKNTRAVSHEDS